MPPRHTLLAQSSVDWEDVDEPEPPVDPELDWADEDTSEDDGNWQPEDLFEDGGDDEIEWDATEGDWDTDLEWSEPREEDAQALLDDADDLFTAELQVPERPIILGWSTHVDLPAHDIGEIPARCSTDCPHSTLQAEFHPGAPGCVRLEILGTQFEVPVEDESGELVVTLQLMVESRVFPLELRLRATSGAPLVILGRDALAGRFLVDVGR